MYGFLNSIRGTAFVFHKCLWFFSAGRFRSWGSEDHRTIQIGRDLRSSLIQPSAQSRVSYDIRPGYSGLYPSGSSMRPRMMMAQRATFTTELSVPLSVICCPPGEYYSSSLPQCSWPPCLLDFPNSWIWKRLWPLLRITVQAPYTMTLSREPLTVHSLRPR